MGKRAWDRLSLMNVRLKHPGADPAARWEPEWSGSWLVSLLPGPLFAKSSIARG